MWNEASCDTLTAPFHLSLQLGPLTDLWSISFWPSISIVVQLLALTAKAVPKYQVEAAFGGFNGLVQIRARLTGQGHQGLIKQSSLGKLNTDFQLRKGSLVLQVQTR